VKDNKIIMEKKDDRNDTVLRIIKKKYRITP